MIVKYVECARWMSRGGRRCAKVVYVFDDGFASLEDAKDKIKKLGCIPENFRYVRFCSSWYAVYTMGYRRNIVVSPSECKGHTEKFQPPQDIKFDASLFASPSVSDRKKWQDGIIKDLTLADQDFAVFRADGSKETNAIMENNVLIYFGITGFASEICVRTLQYVERVLRHYYNPTSLMYAFDEIEEARENGAEYYNFFTKTSSKSYREQHKKLVEKCGGTVPDCIMMP